MDYKRIYDSLVFKARNRILEKETYSEKHHIRPKCLGGTNKKENIVKFLAREHFVAHLLLHKIYPNNEGLLFAIQAMCIASNNQIRNNKMYEWVKIKILFVRSRNMLGDKNIAKKLDVREKISKNTRGKKHEPISEQGRKNMSEAHKGKVFTEEHKYKISIKQKGVKRKPLSEEHKEKLRIIGYKRKLNKEEKSKIGLSKIDRKFINNGLITYCVKKEQIQEYLDKGWIFGRVKKK